MKRMGTTGWVLTGLALVIVLIFGIRLVQLSAEEDPADTVDQIREREGIPVVVAEAERGTLEVWRTFSGTVTGERESVLRARSDDEVREVRVRVGDRVQSGQMLVRQAGQASDARIRQADAALQQAQRQVERLRPLWEAGALSDQDWEDANTRMELARADREALSGTTDGIAPIAGLVSEVPARVGMIPTQGDALVRIVDDSAWRIPLRVSPDQAAELQAGQAARVGTGVDPVVGLVDRVTLQADPRSRLVEVDVRVDGASAAGRLRPGSFATVQVLVDIREEVVRIPRTALRPEGVWVLNGDDVVELREVEAGLQGDEWVEIMVGVDVGERVVTEGARFLSDGARAQVVD
ncbi:MAG: efflux RND transporter periplasmic adaptor subunit [Gemmatimonadales bacterium]|nr:MAG: efflux RND transporter periplasmic adaptor subunit [Gemmatimonadales bacterium]